MLKKIADLTLQKFANIGLSADHFSISLQLFENGKIITDDFQGGRKFYPASIIKLFYLVAAHRFLEDGRIKLTDELERAMKNMIVTSSNDATSYVVDVLTDSTSGMELPEHEMQKWIKKRNVINEYFHSLGYKDININQKTWEDGPYGREKEFLGADYKNRNALTTNCTAMLLSEIAQRKCISKSRSDQMLELLHRDFEQHSDDPDDQARCFSGKGLYPGCRLWSKAGWTSTVRHDAAYIELPEGKNFVLVIFTANHAKRYDIIPFVAAEVLKAMKLDAIGTRK